MLRMFFILVFSLSAFSLPNFAAALTIFGNGANDANSLWTADLRAILERGKVEPNENRDSYQEAKIDIYQIAITRKLPDALSPGSSPYVKIDYKNIRSGAEIVGGRSFYAEDRGNTLGLTYGFSVDTSENSNLSFYGSVTPIRDLNENKFSLPRVDLWNLGMQSSSNWSEYWGFESSILYGSGIAGKQNSYLATAQSFVLKANTKNAMPITFRIGPYAELDLSERFDAQYDAVFTAPGRRDRIRSAKIGFLTSADISAPGFADISIGYIQKLGGYDATATNAITIALKRHL